MPSFIHAIRSTKVEESLINYAVGDQGIDGSSIAALTYNDPDDRPYTIGQE